MSTTELESSVPSSANSSSNTSLKSSTATSVHEENDDLNLVEVLQSTSVQSTSATNYDQPAFGGSEGEALSISWFSSINLSSDAQDKLCFPESLLLVNDSGDPFGKAHFSIVKSEWENNQCLLVYSESSFYDKKLDLHCGTSITGFISPNLTTLQEFTHEWVKQADVYRERKIFLMRENDNKIFYKMVNTEGSEIKSEIKKFINDEGGDHKNGRLLTESSNILFHRLLAFEKRTGSIVLSCLDHCGRICRNSYKYTGTGYEDVYGEKVKVWSIRRSVSNLTDNSQIICQFDSLFTHHARLILRCQPEGQNDFAMIPLTYKCVEPNEIDTGGNIPPVNWECDQEYLSNFLVHKEKSALENKGYLLDHPEINALLGDLMSSILMRKPSNVVEFCSQFFQPFLNYQPITFTSIQNVSLPDDDASEIGDPVQQEQDNESEVGSTSTTSKGDFLDDSNGSVGESSKYD